MGEHIAKIGAAVNGLPLQFDVDHPPSQNIGIPLGDLGDFSVVDVKLTYDRDRAKDQAVG